MGGPESVNIKKPSNNQEPQKNLNNKSFWLKISLIPGMLIETSASSIYLFDNFSLLTTVKKYFYTIVSHIFTATNIRHAIFVMLFPYILFYAAVLVGAGFKIGKNCRTLPIENNCFGFVRFVRKCVSGYLIRPFCATMVVQNDEIKRVNL
jgi:hypothetical protein